MAVAAGIELRKVDVVRGGRPVVEDVTATVHKGLITGLLGPSGCGKSTLMRAIVGVQARVSGTLEVLGLAAGTPALRSRVGYVTQGPAVYADLTARENLRYFARVLGAPAAAVEDALEVVALETHADQAVSRLSGGQQARVSLATALLASPEVLVLDEPTVGLDPVLRRDLWALFRRLADEGATLLISSHVMDEAEHCDRILLMREGRLLARRHARGAARALGRRERRGRLPPAGRAAGACGMSAGRTFATASRVLGQLRRDPRTLALLLVVPSVLLTLLKYLFEGQPETFDRLGGPMLGIFPFVSMFLVTSIAMLRERTSGTLERLMASPIAKADLLCGYGLAFGAVATVQALATGAVAFGALGLEVAGSVALVLLLAVANAILGMALGLFLSAFASTEFQAVQFMPAFVLPQLLLCGLFVPRDQMADALDTLAGALPLTYAFDALDRATTETSWSSELTLDVCVLAGAVALALALGAATLRRRTP